MQKFSIILPVRNGGALLKECIQSLLIQSFDSYNIIVLDNCSDDGTSEWMKQIESEKIIYHSSKTILTIEENWGRIKNVDKNEFMTMIGHDDILLPHYLEEMDSLITLHPDASLYQTHFTYIDENGSFIRNCEAMEGIQSAAAFLEAQMKRKIDSTGTGYMMRSGDFNRLGGMPVDYPNLIFSDYQLWVNLMRLGYKATSAKNCFSYRIHQSVSATTNGEKYLEAFMHYCSFLIEMAKVDKSIDNVIKTEGKEFLYYNCEALSHRLLKTSIKLRSIKVRDFITRCKNLAKEFIPHQEFNPSSRFRIKVAKWLDSFAFTRYLFQLFRKLK